MNIIEDLKRFHTVFDVPILGKPKFPSEPRIKLRQKLIQEEVYELNKAIDARDVVGTAQELVDVIYVTVGTALEFGSPLEQVWDEVHAANMRKIGPSGTVHRRADGKVIKPPNWSPANVLAVMVAAGYKPNPRQARLLAGA